MTQVLTPAGQAEPSAAEPRRAGSTHQKYWDDRKTRLQRGRLVRFLVCIPLWVLSVVPLARELMEGREGANALLVYLAVGAISLAVAAVIRGFYVLLTKRQLVSPWVFVLAAVVAIVAYTVQGAGEEGVPVAAAQALEARA